MGLAVNNNQSVGEFDRSAIHILVTDTHALGMIGVIRSLGRAGYCVHAASSNADALGFRSRFTFATVTHPGYQDDSFYSWLQAYLQNNNIKAIVPSEGFLHAIHDVYDSVKSLLPDAVDQSVWQRCLSKVETQEWLENVPETQVHLPSGKVIRNLEDIPESLDSGSLSGPFYIKGDAGQAIPPNKSAIVERCETTSSLISKLKMLLPQYRELIFQQHATGLKVGVSLWYHNGSFCAENMTLGIHMMPWQGGMMTLRRTFWHDRLLADAKKKMEALGWQGVAMMEYKWEPASDDFWFIEINARYWGYLHLDLYVGKDFPLMQVDAFFGDKRKDMGQPEIDSICRYSFPGEANYLISRLKSVELSVKSKFCSFFGFFLRFLNPFLKADLLFPGDRALYWRALWRWLIDLLSASTKRLKRR